jgi:hypothetical protein
MVKPPIGHREWLFKEAAIVVRGARQRPNHRRGGVSGTSQRSKGAGWPIESISVE